MTDPVLSIEQIDDELFTTASIAAVNDPHLALSLTDDMPHAIAVSMLHRIALSTPDTHLRVRALRRLRNLLSGRA